MSAVEIQGSYIPRLGLEISVIFAFHLTSTEQLLSVILETLEDNLREEMISCR